MYISKHVTLTCTIDCKYHLFLLLLALSLYWRQLATKLRLSLNEAHYNDSVDNLYLALVEGRLQ